MESKVLTLLQEKILNGFGNLQDSFEFYLTGGTALSAFYLRHRRSHDLDFFTNTQELILPLSYQLEDLLKDQNCQVERLRGFSSFVELLIKEKEETIIHLALDSPFRFEEPIESKEFPKVKVDTLIDIATNKLLTLFGRATLRDFIDVYFIIKEYYPKKMLMEKAKQKDPGFDIYWLGIALERIHLFTNESLDMQLLLKPCPLELLCEYFNAWRMEIFSSLGG